MVEKLFLSHFTFFFDVYLPFHVFLTTVQPINLIEVYPIKAYLIDKGVVKHPAVAAVTKLQLQKL
jgi:hypothetical protein